MLKSLFQRFSQPNTQKNINFLDQSYGFSNHSPIYNSKNSYCANVIVFRCINLIAESASHVPWLVLKRKSDHYEKLFQHPIGNLLKNPNSGQAGASFFVSVIASKLLHGNAYILGHTTPNQQLKELYLLDARSMDIEHLDGHPSCYIYQSPDSSQRFDVCPNTMQSNILHLKNYNPNDPLRGLSCLDAAALSIETHSQAVEWNNSLLRNGARPSGALIMREHNQHLSTEQFERLREQLHDKYTNASNSGRPLLLEGGLQWQEMSVSPKDMDFIEAKNSAARDIALAFGVPPQLLGINGDNTYSNMQEARLALWEDTIMPLLDNLSDSLTNWFSQWYEEDIIIDFDRDAISALTTKRENLWGKISDANFMTLNEKRAIVGLPPIDDGDRL